MSELEELSQVEEEEGLQLFPRLSILSVFMCPKLKGSRLVFPPSQFKDFTISFYWKDDVVRFECETDEKINILFSRSKISMVDEWIPWNNLTSTEHLRIVQYSLLSIPREWFQHLTSLRSLDLCLCYNLESLPEEGLPAALQLLHIDRCRYLSERCRMDGPDWHKISHIPYININNEVVQNLRNDDYDPLSDASYYYGKSDDDDE